MEEAQEMLTLAQRHISDELLQQVERHQGCFDMVKAPSRSGSEGAMAAMELFHRLQRNPWEPPVSAERAEDMVTAMEEELQVLQSPVVDVSLPQEGTDRRLVLVGDLHGQLQDVLHIFEEHGLPSDEVAYVFNGDIVDRGHYAVEIWLLVIAFKLSHPQNVFVLRGNHENDQMISRPFKMGGGFSEECLGKYNHSLLAAFQRMFKLLPLFAVIEKEIFVVHGGLFRNPSVNLEMLRQLPKEHWQRNYPNPLTKEELESGKVWTENEEIIFDALWADPHHGLGSKRSERGKVAVMFGEDITQKFLEDANLSLCLRSHRVPQSGRGFELIHGGRLMTLFSASKYGGVLQNHGAVAVLRPGQEQGPAFFPSQSMEETEYPPLRQLQMSMHEYCVHGLHALNETKSASQARCVQQVRRIVEHAHQEHQLDLEQHALGLICAERGKLWSKLREQSASHLVSKEILCQVLSEVCGDLDWPAILQRCAPYMGEEIVYSEFLAAPTVRWYHLGAAQLVTVARASAQAELRLSGLAALFDSPNGMVTPQLARDALGQLLPSLREGQRRQLSTSLFGEETTELSAVLHQLALFADPPQFPEPWMKTALGRIGELILHKHGPPLHSALIQFFKATAQDGSDLLGPKDFVEGLQQMGTYDCSGDVEVPLLHAGRLYQIFEAIDGNCSGTISFLELLLAMDERSARPELPEFPALEGSLCATLLVHKAALLRVCRALDPLDSGRISVNNFVELVSLLYQVLQRPLAEAHRSAMQEELSGEDLAYSELLRGFEVRAEGGPWLWSNECG